jgi:hypothetical protein
LLFEKLVLEVWDFINSGAPRELAPVPVKPLNSDPREAGFSMLNKPKPLQDEPLRRFWRP